MPQKPAAPRCAYIAAIEAKSVTDSPVRILRAQPGSAMCKLCYARAEILNPALRLFISSLPQGAIWVPQRCPFQAAFFRRWQESDQCLRGRAC
jgi:hypothetical protein